ncbi:hypothetical protein AVEN_96007-1 [Araneus ventricosus]|uniref:Uncharacterized protein n=1 Tax=Araneus ventricosus TaxID=182803 RepID=A0A4Y2B634_ARAVE|nr:hypothetical protein AVEN_96007-1 [Araneus ventricosus]
MLDSPFDRYPAPNNSLQQDELRGIKRCRLLEGTRHRSLQYIYYILFWTFCFTNKRFRKEIPEPSLRQIATLDDIQICTSKLFFPKPTTPISVAFLIQNRNYSS